MLEWLKRTVKSRLRRDSLAYNGLLWIYGWMTGVRDLRRAARMWAFRDSRFDESDLSMASSCPEHLLDAVIARWRPVSFLDVGCGIGRSVEYMAGKGVDCLGLEGSTAAIKASPVQGLIRAVNLNKPVDLGRKFDLVWSYEVAEHIHPAYTDIFLTTLVHHGDRIAMSAAQPGQGGWGHFNEQPLSYWIEKMRQRGFSYDQEFSEFLHALPDEYSRNMMFFLRPNARKSDS